jgi:hypothetical protein
MTKKKEYVTEQELEVHRREGGHYYIGWIVVVGYFLAVISFLSIFVIVANGFYNPINGKEMYCAQNETTPKFIDFNCTHCSYESQSSLVTQYCYCTQIYDEVPTNRCLDWRWRDKP